MDIQPGAVIDRYTVLDVLGEGGMAVVYKVQHNDLDSLHALEVLTLQSSKVRERLRSEGKVQAKLRHPNIVTVTDLIDVNGAPGLVMEFIDGPGLDQRLKGPLFSIEQADALGRGIIDGVLEAHRHQLVHRDLKPGNRLLHDRAGNWEPKITDFGLVKAVMANGPGLHQIRAGATMGTPSYMSPEQIRDAASVDERADLFSLGIILYQMVCGRQPFQGSDTLDRHLQHQGLLRPHVLGRRGQHHGEGRRRPHRAVLQGHGAVLGEAAPRGRVYSAPARSAASSSYIRSRAMRSMRRSAICRASKPSGTPSGTSSSTPSTASSGQERMP
jgi:serine/threonine protein kinase